MPLPASKLNTEENLKLRHGTLGGKRQTELRYAGYIILSIAFSLFSNDENIAISLVFRVIGQRDGRTE